MAVALVTLSLLSLQIINCEAQSEQIYTGVKLVWTELPTEGIHGCLLVQHQDVHSGVVTSFLTLKADYILRYYEWLDCGWVQYSNDEKYCYVKYDLAETGWVHEFLGEVEYGDVLNIVFDKRGSQQWRVQLGGSTKLYLDRLFNFSSPVNVFGAYLKSLCRINKVSQRFEDLSWYNQASSWNYWGNGSLGKASSVSTYHWIYDVKFQKYAFVFDIVGQGSYFRRQLGGRKTVYPCVT